MEIYYKNKKLEKLLTDIKEMQRKCGERQTKFLTQRMYEISNSESFSELGKFAGVRLHPLKGDRKGQYSVDLDGPYRLILKPHRSVQQLPTGGIDPSSVKSVIIVEIANTHE